jgi:colanic acid biosynthesis protein WcaH
MISKEDYLHCIDLRPLISIDLIIRNDSDQVLLGKRLNEPAMGTWFVPGGVIYKNETQADALQRISLRELGIQISHEHTSLLGVYEHFYETNFAQVPRISTHYVVIGRSYQLPVDTKLTFDDQHECLEWWNIQDLLKSPEVHQYTRDYFLK